MNSNEKLYHVEEYKMSKIVHISESELKRMCVSIFVNGAKFGVTSFEQQLFGEGKADNQKMQTKFVNEGLRCFKDHLNQFEMTKSG